jgi:hypothetical protein
MEKKRAVTEHELLVTLVAGVSLLILVLKILFF